MRCIQHSVASISIFGAEVLGFTCPAFANKFCAGLVSANEQFNCCSPILAAYQCCLCRPTVQPEAYYCSEVSSDAQTPNEKGDVDPFVALSLYDPARNDSERQETSKLVNEPDPKWGEKFDFIMASATSVLTVDVWDSLGWLEGRLSLKGLTGAPLS